MRSSPPAKSSLHRETNQRKLLLNRETVRRLHPVQLRGAHGGQMIEISLVTTIMGSAISIVATGYTAQGCVCSGDTCVGCLCE
jgi:hypothetical protein